MIQIKSQTIDFNDNQFVTSFGTWVQIAFKSDLEVELMNSKSAELIYIFIFVVVVVEPFRAWHDLKTIYERIIQNRQRN